MNQNIPQKQHQSFAEKQLFQVQVEDIWDETERV
jgi:hypothetical protein